jgi:hypothetical protein
MTTPNRNEILERARELYAQDCHRRGCPELANVNPEASELAESGFVSVAKSELMMNADTKNVQWITNVSENSDFMVDIQQLFDSNALILGSRHTGKSDLAMMISDLAMQKNAFVVVFDPSQDWIARSNIKRYVKVEPYTILEVPSESVIYDMSLCSPQDQQRIVENFAKNLFEHQAQAANRKQYLVIFEEAHSYYYQNAMRSKNAVNSVRMLSVGRNVRIACLLVSQFASMIDKFCIKHSTSQMWCGFTREANDIAYLKRIMGAESEKLSKLNDGEFLYLTRDGTRKISIEPYEVTVQKTQIATPEIIIRPITPTHNDAAEVLRVLMFLGLFGLIVLVLGNMR